MSSASLKRRLAAAALAAATLALPLIPAASSSADPIADKQAEARQIAAQLEQLQHQAEVYSEQYNQASVQLADVESKVTETAKRVDAAKAQIDQRKKEVARYAVASYVRGGNSSALPLMLNSTGADMGQRQGYANAAIGNREELINRLDAAKVDAQHQIDSLNVARSQAQAARDAVSGKKAAAEAAVAKGQALQNKVQGELASLVAQEQARRAAEQQAAAIAKAKALAAAQAAALPAAPAAVPAVTPRRPATTGGGGGGGSTTTTTPPAPDPGPAPPSSGGSAVVAAAQRMLGVPYVWGGSSPSGFDCSGLVMWAFAQAGMSVPRVATAQYNASRHIPLSDLQPGDLVFYGGDAGFMDHVAIYAGGGMIIHAPHSGSYVKYDSLYYWSAIAGAGRF